MLAQDRHDGSEKTERSTSKRQSRRPTKFMFIDSSNGGVNAKPDRVVRSFVMKSARNKKTWSTRPKSPKEEVAVEAGLQQQPHGISQARDESSFAAVSWPPQDFRKDSLWDNCAVASPVSTRSGSSFSTYNGSYTCDSPLSGHTSPFAEYSHAAHAPSDPLRHNAVARRVGFDVGFKRSLDCLPVRLDAHMHQLLDLFIEGSAPRLLPVDCHSISSVAATDWMTRSIQSPSGAPYIYAALTASSRALGLNSEAYKWQAIAEVNKLLSNPKTCTDDTTIASVLILLNLEQSSLAESGQQGSDRERSLSANRAHLNGLRTMIGQRGGLTALQTNRCLQVFILMHSIAQCITTFKRPYILPFDSTGHVEDYALAVYPIDPPFLMTTPLQRTCSDMTLLRILRSFNLYISDLTRWYDTGRTPHSLDPFGIQKHGCLLEYRLFDWYKKDETSEIAGRLASGPLDQCICLAHLIFLVMATEPNTQSFGARLSKVVRKLRQSLQRVPTSHWATVPDAFFWVLTMGALAAKGLPRSQRIQTSDFAFFTQYSQLAFTQTAENNVSVTAHNLLQRLHRCPWISMVFDAQAKRVWGQMGLCVADVFELYDSSSEDDEPPVDDEHALGRSTTARFFPASRPGSKKSSPQ